MKITFCGAAQAVTGSSFLIETDRVRFIVDCGMFQGTKEIRSFNQGPFLYNPAELDFMLLSHAHIDHAGLIPRLCKSGFKQPIYATKATVELSKISLPDAGHIQEMEAEWRNRKRQRKGLSGAEPFYTAAEAMAALKFFNPVDYGNFFEPARGIKVRFQDAGHILGSSLVEIWVTEAGKTIKLVYSGDLGQADRPIINDPTYIREADYVLIESTYGDRNHPQAQDKEELLQKVVRQTIGSGGNLIIPAFAVGRTQEILYHLKNLIITGRIPRLPVYIDSPMAVSVTEVYRQSSDYYDEDTLKMLSEDHNPFEFEGLHFIRTAEESKQLNQIAKGAIIISASGMCEAGRILHHLKHNLWRPESHILFVGYQAEGTLGRRLADGAEVVKIMGEEVKVRAVIHQIDGFSAHADQNGLLEWLAAFDKPFRELFIVHGEPAVQREFAAEIQRRFGIKAQIPQYGERFILDTAAHLSAPGVVVEHHRYQLEKTLADMEHAVLALRSQIRMAESSGSAAQLAELRQLLDQLEGLLEEPA